MFRCRVTELETATHLIREELKALVDEAADFRPYVQNDPDRPHRDFGGLNEDPSWTALYLWKDGEVVEERGPACCDVAGDGETGRRPPRQARRSSWG